jgi:hypothetical protein
MVWCKSTIQPILLGMFFLWALYPCYEDLLKRFRSWYKSLDSTSSDSIAADVHYHDEFKLVGMDNKKSPARKTPCAAMAATNVDRQGKEWNNLFEWLSTLQVNSLKTQWKGALAGTKICPICHCMDDKHVSANRPLLKGLNLKLVCGPPPAATPPVTTPAPAAPEAHPSGWLAVADNFSAANTTGQTTAPSGLVATLAEEDFESDKEFVGRKMRGVLIMP